MPAFICCRRTSVFSVLFGVVIGFSLAYCFVILNYCVSVYKVSQQHKILTVHTADENLSAVTVIKQAIKPRTSSSIKCDDTPLQSAFKQRGDFWVLYNYVKAAEEFNCDETITYTTHGDYTFLDNLPVLVERWQGPVSVALFAPGYDFNATLDAIAYLRNCDSGLIRTFVSFHVFFGYKDVPYGGEVPLLNRYKDTFNCTEPPPYINVDKTNTYKRKNKLTYPINIARNIAKETTQTHFILPSDIELYPTRDLIPKFLSMAESYKNLTPNVVFVLPLYEIPADQQIPDTKTDLQEMLKNQTAFIFHKNLCLMCHKVPESERWEKQLETEGLSVFSSGRRSGKYKYWEPFYIGTKDEPFFDERLTWEGQSNKMTQGYIMCLLNYTYLVLDNAFLIHKPGVKKAKVQLKEHLNMVRSTNKMIHDVIKDEIITIYGDNDECYL